MQKSRQKYRQKFKIEAVNLSLELGSMADAARRIGVSAENIRRWQQQLKHGKLGLKTRTDTINDWKKLKRLTKELVQVKLERDLLKECGRYLSAGSHLKFKYIEEHLNIYPIKKMCKVLEVSTSGYYKWKDRTPSKREQYNLVLLEKIKEIHHRNKRRYGSSRIAKELQTAGFHASEKHIRKLMKTASLQSF